VVELVHRPVAPMDDTRTVSIMQDAKRPRNQGWAAIDSTMASKRCRSSACGPGVRR
jgi:hypothetical protein